MIMALTDIPKRFPLATLFGSLILVGAAGSVATGSDLANQLMSTVASAVVSRALLLGVIPDLARWRAPAVSTVRLAAGVVAVGALRAICCISHLLSLRKGLCRQRMLRATVEISLFLRFRRRSWRPFALTAANG